MSTLKAMDQMFNLLDDIFHKPPPKAVSMLEGFIEMDSGRHRTEIRWRRPPSLKEAKKFVGSGKRGCVEIVWCEGPTEEKIQVLSNEEGLLLPMSRNAAASAIAGTRIVGPALILIGDARWMPGEDEE